MNKYLLARGFGALLLANTATLVSAQEEKEESGGGERRVRIEISRNENGRTSHMTREFDLNNDAELHDALRELGVLDELVNIGDGENVTFDLRRMDAGGPLNDMCMGLAWPADMSAFKPEPRPYLGVYYGDQPSGKAGARITGVEEGSPAEKAGLKEGDRVVEIAGRKVENGKDLAEAVADRRSGEKVKVIYYRGKQKKSLEVELGARDGGQGMDRSDFAPFSGGTDWDWDQYFGDNGEEGEGAFLGVMGGSDTENGVRIGEVVEGSAAECMGLKEGDILRSINGEAIGDFSELVDRINGMSPEDHVDVGIARDGREMVLNGNLGGRKQPYSYGFGGNMAPLPLMPEGRSFRDAARARADEARARGEEMRAQMDELRQEMDRLRQELRGGSTREMHVNISPAELSTADKALLSGKGVTGLDRPLELDVQCYPERSDEAFHLRFEVPERGDLSVDLRDANGERVYHEVISGFKGSYERTLDVSDQAAGTYFLVIAQNGRSTARKLLKK
ncbi:MAG: PDZ domain-containing protein [Flavobacteriales bacterium]